MNTQSDKFKVRLGLFVIGGLVLFVLAIFIIGKQKNLFNPVFKLSTFYGGVGGLQVGNNVRFSGINVGTVDNIQIVNDTTVKVDMMIQVEVQKFIKSDCKIAIGSEGIIGDRILNITQGTPEAASVKEGEVLESIPVVDMDAIMVSVAGTANNAEIASSQLAEILFNINNGQGTLGRLIQDSSIAENIDMTIQNLKKSSKGLSENMEAAKSNVLLKGYFNKKKRAADKKQKEEDKETEKEKDKQNDK